MLDHSTSCFRNAPKKQTERPPSRTPQNIPVVSNGKSGCEHSKKLGRWDSTTRFRSLAANHCSDTAETQGDEAEGRLVSQETYSFGACTFHYN